jgi:hypothetical protein
MIRYGLRPPVQRLVPQRRNQAATAEPTTVPEPSGDPDRRSARTAPTPAQTG